ncbi:type II toxin-antitoxin system RelE/ParE family toxin [Salmonella enterica]|uniref:Type II toxin-antitoxin system RelE/ParE family toxin n=2 Tax=Salmonella enterica TaxID=28901 RepID=A0A5Y3PVJ2_SALER|nr:plasmid stabilization protein [Salmonella enterica subsp. arizonae serovar 53:-:- str. SA20100345]EAA8368585.1 type II toxin-antitoxin system RelE/ParE family toxin [Salmonella enterica]ECC1650637.1 type II toxin-antitoxin system RelE/ParE family toxin [Salmonella enterica subsp. arizonae]ECU8515549.1 type II toxin-antitoxin system RelE/ParE family toxin [Salmonella enterica subsp. arizonae serovar 44:z4,z23,z32:-]EDU1960399.1 type II toxin-antitoxin system RelE/ParE family toxin [Salmonella
MKQQVTFEYTLTVKHCIDIIAGFLRRVDVEPRPVIADILTQFESAVAQFPLGCQIYPELLKIGCAKYREFNHAEGYRVLYSVDGALVTAHAILAHRQDVQQLLFKRLIMA